MNIAYVFDYEKAASTAGWIRELQGEHTAETEEYGISSFTYRTQQLVFIGRQMDEAAMRARLDACLLDERLASADSEAWAGLRNPFPEFLMAEEPA